MNEGVDVCARVYVYIHRERRRVDGGRVAEEYETIASLESQESLEPVGV